MSVRDHIEGSFVGKRAVYADAKRVYLASFQGTLFVLARDRWANFPVVQIINDTSVPLVSVQGDQRRLYVADMSGTVRIYRKDDSLKLIRTAKLTVFASAMELFDGKLFIAVSPQIAVNENHVYASVPEVSENHTVHEFDKTTLSPGPIYDASVGSSSTMAFSRITGGLRAEVPNQIDVLNRPSISTLYADEQLLVSTTAGCCGRGIQIFDAGSMALKWSLNRNFVNTVERHGRWLVTGNETGAVDLFDLRASPPAVVASLDLPRLTGHLAPEDIEIRALWMDGVDTLIFAASSWGNDRTRSSYLPSLFVLELM